MSHDNAGRDYDSPEDRERRKGLYEDAYIRLGNLALRNVADLGCGDGPFPAVLAARKNPTNVYWGVDKDVDRVARARERLPGWQFSIGELFSAKIQAEFVKYDGFLLLEMLDFMKDGLELVSTIPSGRPLVASFTMHEAPGRINPIVERTEIHDRYSAAVKVESIGKYRHPAGHFWYVMVARRW